MQPETFADDLKKNTQPVFTCSKSLMETFEEYVKPAQSYIKKSIVLVFL